MKERKYSMAVCGGAFGDEGKGRIVDEYVNALSAKRKVILYRDNGGANAGHTVEFGDVRIALHQLPSGVFTKNATIILGKGMVIHPGDLLLEINEVEKATHGKVTAEILVDEMAIVSLDLHRAFESVLRDWQEGGKASTGRGISPAYCDVLLRHPLRMRDLKSWDEKKIRKHYKMYEAWVKGMNLNIADIQVNTLDGKLIPVGNETEFIKRLKKQSTLLSKYICDVYKLIDTAWKNSKKYAFVFEKAQAIGLDYRYGVYPDITASDCTAAGITYSTQGIVDSLDIQYRIAVIKGTYMSSVGLRVLPSKMEDDLASRIREDAHEYGATTKRPRGIAYLDLVALKFYKEVGYSTHLALTHMDIVYPDTPVKVCIGYKLNGKDVAYRPDQEFLNKVKPVFKEFPTWKAEDIKNARTEKEIPTQAKKFLSFVEKYMGIPILMITTGPERDQSIKLLKF